MLLPLPKTTHTFSYNKTSKFSTGSRFHTICMSVYSLVGLKPCSFKETERKARIWDQCLSINQNQLTRMCETLHPWDPLYLCQSWPQTGSPHSQVCELSPAPPGHLRIHIGQWCSWHELTITSHALKHIYNLTLPLTCTLPSNPELILHWTQMHKQHLSSQSVCAYISCPVKIDDHTGRHTAFVWCQGSFILAKVVNTGRKLNTNPWS